MKTNIPAKETRPTSEQEGKLQSIQRRAYDIFQGRGQKPGHELEDWLRAEQEVSGQKDSQAVH